MTTAHLNAMPAVAIESCSIQVTPDCFFVSVGDTDISPYSLSVPSIAECVQVGSAWLLLRSASANHYPLVRLERWIDEPVEPVDDWGPERSGGGSVQVSYSEARLTDFDMLAAPLLDLPLPNGEVQVRVYVTGQDRVASAVAECERLIMSGERLPGAEWPRAVEKWLIQFWQDH